MIVATAMVGAAWALAVSRQARSDTRSVVAHALPPDERSWTGSLKGGTAAQWSVVSTSWPPDAPGFSEKVREPVRVAALAVADAFETLRASSTDALVTGSLGKSSGQSFVLASADASLDPSRLTDAQTPLPRARPKLASLSPMDGLRSKPDEEVRPPRTAVYDITAKLVYLPSGERLEAHSGWGPFMDDPRFVQKKNRGATPPNTYELRFRESLFHGVRAIRLIPVNEKDMFGRDGILAHSYMLGPNGQSNGCVSFKDYPRFLRAFRRGEIERIVVVTHLAKPPTFATAPGARSTTNTL